MMLYITILILALLVPVIMQTHGIDQPNSSYKRAQLVGHKKYNFILPRGQPALRASIINHKTTPRNKGEPRKNSS
jgi:hypothetical protein